MERKILSLQEARTKKQKLLTQQYKDSDTRIGELEDDVFKAIDMLLDMEKELDRQGKFIRKMLHLIQDRDKVK